jgi:hypothetical protein
LYHPASSRFYLTAFSSFVSFRKIDWHALDSATCVKPALFGLLCAWREVLILRQHLHFARILLASSIYKNTALRSGGRSHAHDAASQLTCGFIAQQCSALASYNPMVLFIAEAAPRVAGAVMTLSPRDEETCCLCIIKGDDITFPDSRRLCRLCINDA